MGVCKGVSENRVSCARVFEEYQTYRDAETGEREMARRPRCLNPIALKSEP